MKIAIYTPMGRASAIGRVDAIVADELVRRRRADRRHGPAGENVQGQVGDRRPVLVLVEHHAL
jgi:hypothetical protein